MEGQSPSRGFKLLLFSNFWCHLISAALGELTISVAERDAEQRDLMFDQSRTISLTPGLTYVIVCTISNYGSFPFNPWTRDGSDVIMMNHEDASETDPLVFYDSSHSSKKELYLIMFDSTLTGEYICQSSDDSKTLTITASNPAIILDNIYVEGIEGKSSPVIINTILYGNPVPMLNNVTWFFDGSPLNAEDLGISSLLSTGETFVFSLVYNRKQTGLYTAVVSTSAGTSNDSFTLQVFTPPIVTFTSDCNCLSNDEIIVAKNSSFNLSCVDTNSDPLPEFTWFKDDDVLESSNYIGKEAVSPTESRLVFSNILPEHAGVYICKANNTMQKDTKGVSVYVKYVPQLSAVSPSSIAVPVGRKIQLLVEYGGGFPDPQVNWSHYNGVERVGVLNNSRTQQHGLFGINLTISDVLVGDEGTYTLEVNNTVETIVLEFNVTVLVPPTLLRLSNLTTHSPVGGKAVFIVGVVDAQPAVVESNLVWKGNFDSSQGQMTFENEEAVLEISDLKLSDSGNVTLTVEHTGGNVQLYYEFIVLNVPDAPSLANIQSNGTCLVEVLWGTSEPLPTTALTDEVMLEQQSCSYRDATCDEQKWELLQVYPSDIQSASVPLLPDKCYSFRLVSCSDLVGCGDPWTVPERVNTSVEGFNLRVSGVHVSPVNSSSLKLGWNGVTQQSDCYELTQYEVYCWNTNDKDTPEVFIVTNEALNVVLTDLETDSEYNCLIRPVYNDLFGNKAQTNVLPSYGIGRTYPSVPIVNKIIAVIDQLGESSIKLKLTNSFSFFIQMNISHIHICVLRLGDSPITPLAPPDELYHSLSNFSDYELVHSERDRSNYRPYIAAELDVRYLPAQFTIGAGNTDNSRQRNCSNNGPLNSSDYYTVFIRLYAMSQFGKQYSVFTSSEFSSPVKPAAAAATTATSSTSKAYFIPLIVCLALLTVVVLMLIVLCATVIASYVRRKINRKGAVAIHEIVMEVSPAYEVTSATKEGYATYDEVIPTSSPPLSPNIAYESHCISSS